MHPFATPTLITAGGRASILFTDSSVDATDIPIAGGAYTFANQDTGSGLRHIIVVAAPYQGGSSAPVISSVVVGGSTATHVVTASARGPLGIYITPVATSATSLLSIVVNIAPVGSGISAAGGCGIGVYAVTGLLSVTPTATDTETSNNTALSVAVSSGGVAVAACAYTTGSSTVAWTGVTEAYDEDVEVGVFRHSGGSTSSATGATLSITPNASSSVGNFKACAATFR